MANDAATRNFFGGFDSTAHMQRFLMASGGFMLALALATVIVVQVADLKFSGGGIEVNVAGQKLDNTGLKSINLEDSGFLIETSDGNRLASVLLPSNQLWLNTKIRIKPGQVMKMRASGSANLAEQLNLNAINDPRSYATLGFNFLVDPYGRRLNWPSQKANKQRNRNADELRNLIKLKPDYPLGTLIGVVMPDDSFIESNPVVPSAFAISDQEDSRGIAYRGKAEGTLFLAVNDIVGVPTKLAFDAWMLRLRADGRPLSETEQDRELCDAFPLAECTAVGRAAQREGMERRWNYMLNARHWEAFFEDNSGNYMVTVSISAA